MRLLLDTNVVLRQVEGTSPGPQAQQRLDDAEQIWLSVVSFVEIGIKVGAGKLSAPDDLEERVARDGIRIMAITPAHGLALGRLPLHHRDPFDRLLVAQARAEGLTLVTADADLARYDVAVLDALA